MGKKEKKTGIGVFLLYWRLFLKGTACRWSACCNDRHSPLLELTIPTPPPSPPKKKNHYCFVPQTGGIYPIPHGCGANPTRRGLGFNAPQPG